MCFFIVFYELLLLLMFEIAQKRHLQWHKSSKTLPTLRCFSEVLVGSALTAFQFGPEMKAYKRAGEGSSGVGNAPRELGPEEGLRKAPRDLGPEDRLGKVPRELGPEEGLGKIHPELGPEDGGAGEGSGLG